MIETEAEPTTVQDPEMSSFIEVRDLVVDYGSTPAVRGISFSVLKGEHLSLLGPSGCGKTTTLRSIAGLETPSAGEIFIGGKCVFSARARVRIPSEARNLSMVFQSYAIWPHMNVFNNVAYGLRVRHVPRTELKDRVEAALRLVGMEGEWNRPATKLSGGQQQRVALARSYAFDPHALLLDEPLSNLDARLRARMREELRLLTRRLGITTIYVTHDQEEAMALSDRIIVMRDGAVEQEGEPLEVYNHPRTKFVADFIGSANLVEGDLRDCGDGRVVLHAQSAEILLASTPMSIRASPRATIAVRTVHPHIGRRPLPVDINQWPARVVRRTLLGDMVQYLIEWPGGELQVRTFPTDLLEAGDHIYLHIPREHAVIVE